MIPSIQSGQVVRHHNGNVYTILLIANCKRSESSKHPRTVIYIGANGNLWARPIEEFREKFTVIYDGITKAKI